MCGRYYVDDETAREIERIIRMADDKLKRMSAAELTLQAKDIHPTDTAPILMQSDAGLCCRMQKWGFPGFDGKGLYLMPEVNLYWIRRCLRKVWRIGEL